MSVRDGSTETAAGDESHQSEMAFDNLDQAKQWLATTLELFYGDDVALSTHRRYVLPELYRFQVSRIDFEPMSLSVTAGQNQLTQPGEPVLFGDMTLDIFQRPQPRSIIPRTHQVTFFDRSTSENKFFVMSDDAGDYSITVVRAEDIQ